ncbi:uncharacterized protein LOC128260626 [Drosophila gunungcola]|uniref:LITAF domain-containing protein n=1 Tax=Drosophila gunungcola TaxID=103775 RepID=A0A9P9YEI6_9MUSC|nr:uncharacterized protein LOC128260626 [Drosophila gunungcola]KAI8035508.1 hypothetical protein M5D96_011731 [Drosophila gunungcola]
MAQPSLPQGNEKRLRCLRCNKKIKSSRYETSRLARHNEQKHPEINLNRKPEHKLASKHGITEDCLAQNSIMKESQKAEKADRLNDMPRLTVHWRRDLDKCKKTPTAACNASATKDHLCLCAKDKAMSTRNQFLKDSVYRWSALDGKLFCPACGCKRRPLIKAASELESGWYANCWIFCLLPCLMSSDNQEYLYCSKCKTFLGIYNREKNIVRPNREFV